MEFDESCQGESYVQEIDRAECIGNSLTKINYNFKQLDMAACDLLVKHEDLSTRVDTLSTHLLQVEYSIKSRPIFFEMDTRGLSIQGAGAGSVVSFLNVLAPTRFFNPYTEAHILGVQQNVSSSSSIVQTKKIGRYYVSGVNVSTTVGNPSRNARLIYRVNSSKTSWQYVQG
jgi:hypothetical protein